VRVVYYTRPNYFDAALGLVAELSRRVDLHLLLEVAPESWRSNLLDIESRDLRPGIVAADPILREHFPPAVRTMWSQCKSFDLVVHRQPRSLHPATFGVALTAARWLGTVRPDVVHMDDLSLRSLGLLLTLGRMSTVVSVHDPDPHSGERSWRTVLTRRIMLRSARQFVLHNAAQRSTFCHRYRVDPRRAHVVHLGPYDAYRAFSAEVPSSAGAPMVLFFGRLSPYKGLDVLYRAAARVAEEVPGVRFVVAGRPIGGYAVPSPPDLTGGAAIDVRSHYITNAALADLFQRAAVVVCPYTDATQSGVVMTAYAFGVPVVASHVGGLPEYVNDGQSGLLVPPGDANVLASALIRVLGEPGLHSRLQQGVKEIVAGKLSWAHAADCLVDDVYRGAGR
jgi:glycosyltransferase involved in cell wall biosynthesis